MRKYEWVLPVLFMLTLVITSYLGHKRHVIATEQMNLVIESNRMTQEVMEFTYRACEILNLDLEMAYDSTGR